MGDSNGSGELGKLGEILAEIDAANARDPNLIEVGGEKRPAELVYGERMSSVLERLYPGASDELRIAARAQHIQRWTVPRTDYPMDRKGYLRWRSDLKERHAVITGEIMERCGCPAAQIERVGALVRKAGARRDREAQAVEDVACVVFLEHYFADFAEKHDDDKLVSILQKTWRKMSDIGHKGAQDLDMSPRLAGLVARALDGA